MSLKQEDISLDNLPEVITSFRDARSLEDIVMPKIEKKQGNLRAVAADRHYYPLPIRINSLCSISFSTIRNLIYLYMHSIIQMKKKGWQEHEVSEIKEVFSRILHKAHIGRTLRNKREQTNAENDVLFMLACQIEKFVECLHSEQIALELFN